MNSGIQPTIELASNNGNGNYPYPVYPYANNNNDGFFGGEGIWAIILLALLFNGGFGGFGGFGGGYGNMFEFPWLMNGHITAIIDNVLVDTHDCSNEMIKCCWQIM